MQSMTKRNDLELAMDIFTKTGECSHKWTEESRPYNCDVTLKNCIVCGKELERWYHNE